MKLGAEKGIKAEDFRETSVGPPLHPVYPPDFARSVAVAWILLRGLEIIVLRALSNV